MDAYIRKQAEGNMSTSCRSRIERQRKAEAELSKHKKKPKLEKAQAEARNLAHPQEAEVDGGIVPSAGARLKLEAEASVFPKFQKAEAMKKMQEAAITEMVVDKLSEIAPSLNH